MDYKKIIKDRKKRVELLKKLDFIPDRVMLSLQYRIKFGRRLSLNNPKRFSEKLQWYKLFYYSPLMPICAGKNRSRDYVKQKGLDYILNEQYGVFNKGEEIDFSALPDKFVLKSSVGSASQEVFVCTDKSTINKDNVIRMVNNWLKSYPDIGRKKNVGREWPYDCVKSEIIAEKYIDSSSCNDGLVSYKIFCFNGRPKFVYMVVDIKKGYFDADYGIYDIDFNRLPYNRVCEANLEPTSSRPENWNKMIEIASILSEDFPHVRVDLYNINGKIIFGELTFFNDSGYMRYSPDEFDFIAGDMFELPSKIKKPKGYREIKI